MLPLLSVLTHSPKGCQLSKPIDLLYVTFDHKWAEWVEQGYPDRSSAVLESLTRSPLVRNLVVVNSARSLFLGPARSAGDERWARRKSLLRLEEIDEKLYVVHQMRTFPKEKSNRIAHGINKRLHGRRFVAVLREWLSELGMDNLVVWISNPLDADLLGRFDERVSLYDAYDDWCTHPAYRHLWRAFDENYRVIARRADVVLAVSEKLKQRFSDLGGPGTVVVRVPNAVNPEAMEAAVGVPQDLRTLARPILGYLGALQERVDVELLRHVALAFAGASVVLVGPLVSPRHFERLRGLPNVHFLGRKNHADTPRYIKNFDVCLMPHVVNDLTRSMDPLKLYEYFAAGKPTVVTSIPELRGFAPYMYVADDQDEFVANVDVALGERDATAAAVRKSFAKENSWDRRTSDILGLLQDHGLGADGVAGSRSSRQPHLRAGSQLGRGLSAGSGHGYGAVL